MTGFYWFKRKRHLITRDQPGSPLCRWWCPASAARTGTWRSEIYERHCELLLFYILLLSCCIAFVRDATGENLDHNNALTFIEHSCSPKNSLISNLSIRVKRNELVRYLIYPIELVTRSSLSTNDTYKKSGHPSFRVSSVISQGIDSSGHEPHSSES